MEKSSYKSGVTIGSFVQLHLEFSARLPGILYEEERILDSIFL